MERVYRDGITKFIQDSSVLAVLCYCLFTCQRPFLLTI